MSSFHCAFIFTKSEKYKYKIKNIKIVLRHLSYFSGGVPSRFFLLSSNTSDVTPRRLENDRIFLKEFHVLFIYAFLIDES